MDDRLKAYMAQEAGSPPRIDEARIAAMLAQRGKRLSLIMLSLAGALWALLLYAAAFWVGKRIDPRAAAVLMLCLSLSYVCAGCFAGLVVRCRKVGY
jgi:hypothetical protein